MVVPLPSSRCPAEGNRIYPFGLWYMNRPKSGAEDWGWVAFPMRPKLAWEAWVGIVTTEWRKLTALVLYHT